MIASRLALKGTELRTCSSFINYYYYYFFLSKSLNYKPSKKHN